MARILRSVPSDAGPGPCFADRLDADDDLFRMSIADARARVTVERDILGKVTAYFANAQN